MKKLGSCMVFIGERYQQGTNKVILVKMFTDPPKFVFRIQPIIMSMTGREVLITIDPSVKMHEQGTRRNGSEQLNIHHERNMTSVDTRTLVAIWFQTSISSDNLEL